MKYILIVNPISGSADKTALIAQIETVLKSKSVDFQIITTSYPGHARELAEQFGRETDTVIVAIGGDGTVNEIGSALLHSNTPLGLIPVGSGNGLARHLKIPLQPLKALEVILEHQVARIDAGELNGKPFFITCGFGFEAEVTHNFNARKSRGLIGYVKEVLKLYPLYSSAKYRLQYNQKEKKRDAFSITIANSSQYGNNAVIAKDASVSDGLLDLCVIKNYPKLFGPQLGLSLFLQNLHNSSFYRAEKVTELELNLEIEAREINAHIDGEAIHVDLPARIVCIPNALNILVGKNWM